MVSVQIIQKQESKNSIRIPDHFAKLKEKDIFFVLLQIQVGGQHI